MENDDQKILNLIADIRTATERLEDNRKRLREAEIALEEAKEDVEIDEQDARALREELDRLLDELIPDTDKPDPYAGYIY